MTDQVRDTAKDRQDTPGIELDDLADGTRVTVRALWELPSAADGQIVTATLGPGLRAQIAAGRWQLLGHEQADAEPSGDHPATAQEPEPVAEAEPDPQPEPAAEAEQPRTARSRRKPSAGEEEEAAADG